MSDPWHHDLVSTIASASHTKLMEAKQKQRQPCVYKGIIVFQSVADNYTDPKSSNTSQAYVMRSKDSRSAKGRETI